MLLREYSRVNFKIPFILASSAYFLPSQSCCALPTRRTFLCAAATAYHAYLSFVVVVFCFLFPTFRMLSHQKRFYRRLHAILRFNFFSSFLSSDSLFVHYFCALRASFFSHFVDSRIYSFNVQRIILALALMRILYTS